VTGEMGPPYQLVAAPISGEQHLDRPDNIGGHHSIGCAIGDGFSDWLY